MIGISFILYIPIIYSLFFIGYDRNGMGNIYLEHWKEPIFLGTIESCTERYIYTK